MQELRTARDREVADSQMRIKGLQLELDEALKKKVSSPRPHCSPSNDTATSPRGAEVPSPLSTAGAGSPFDNRSEPSPLPTSSAHMENDELKRLKALLSNEQADKAMHEMHAFGLQSQLNTVSEEKDRLAHEVQRLSTTVERRTAEMDEVKFCN